MEAFPSSGLYKSIHDTHFIGTALHNLQDLFLDNSLLKVLAEIWHK